MPLTWGGATTPVGCCGGEDSPVTHGVSTDRMGRRFSPLPAEPWRGRQSEKHQHGLIETQDILVVEPARPCADLGLRDGRGLVDHYPAGQAKSVSVGRLSSCTMTTG